MLSDTTISFAPLIATGLIWFLGSLAFILTGLAAFKGLKGWIWRGLAGLGLVAILSNPSLLQEDRESLSDIALLVIDDSLSMAVGDRQEDASIVSDRIREAAGRDTSLDLVEFSGGRAEDGTRLVEAIREGLADIPRNRLAGIITVTDGRLHDLPNDPDTLGLDAPLHQITVGDPEAGDRRLVIENAPRFGLVGERVIFDIRVEDVLEPAGTATVFLSVDGGERISANIPIGENVPIEALIRNRGVNVVEIEVAPSRNELSLINNRAAVSVTGVRDRLQVLLVTGEPHNGARAWRDLLKSDPSVELIHFTILRPLEKDDSIPPEELSLIQFPYVELFDQRINDFDLVIFDRYRRRGILPPLYFNNIARYVEQGGALLVTAGPPFAGFTSVARTPLAGVLPSRPTGEILEEQFRPALSEAGLRHPVTAPLINQSQDWGPWFRQIGAEAVSGETLLENENGDPLLVLSREAQGRAAILMSDQAWLWDRGYEGGGPHDELFRRVAHWLMGEPELDEERLLASVVNNELRVTRTTLEDNVPPLELTWPSGDTQSTGMVQTAPGRHEAMVPVEETGLIRLRSGELTTVASAGPLNPREYANLSIDPDGLESLTDASGGGTYLAGDGAEDSPSIRRTRRGNTQRGLDWVGLQRNETYIVTDTERTPLTPALLALVLMLGLIGFAWRREGG